MVRCSPDARLVHASSSAVCDPHRYGLYGAAKVLAHNAVVGYRGILHCSNAVLFSHTSPRQDARFLAPRICSTVARIAAGSRELLRLGDVRPARDWGYAPDYMRALRVIGEQDGPGDWIVSTREQHSVRDLTEAALTAAGLAWDDVVSLDPDATEYPDELPPRGYAYAQGLGWRPGTGFADMVGLMVGGEVR
jgi:GDPmannose 4,6-dehydratase